MRDRSSISTLDRFAKALMQQLLLFFVEVFLGLGSDALIIAVPLGCLPNAAQGCRLHKVDNNA